MKKPLPKMGLMVYLHVICNYVQSLVDQSRASCESQMFMNPDNRPTVSTVIHCYSGLWGGGSNQVPTLAIGRKMCTVKFS